MFRCFTLAITESFTLCASPAHADPAPATTQQYRDQARAELEMRMNAAARPANAAS